MEGFLRAASPWLFIPALFWLSFFKRNVACERPGRRRQPRKLLRSRLHLKPNTGIYQHATSLLWCSENFHENSHPQLCNMAPRKRTVSEHSLAWMQKWISASCLNDSGGEAVWSGLIYGWLKYTVIKIMRHRLILQNIRYSPTGTWKAANCDAQTNTKNLSNCAQLGLFLHLHLHLYGWLAAF